MLCTVALYGPEIKCRGRAPIGQLCGCKCMAEWQKGREGRAVGLGMALHGCNVV